MCFSTSYDDHRYKREWNETKSLNSDRNSGLFLYQKNVDRRAMLLCHSSEWTTKWVCEGRKCFWQMKIWDHLSTRKPWSEDCAESLAKVTQKNHFNILLHKYKSISKRTLVTISYLKCMMFIKRQHSVNR